MEKITITNSSPSLKYRFLTKLASWGNPILSKKIIKDLNKDLSIQKSYKTNPFKKWAKQFSQTYVNGIQTFIINETGTKSLIYFHGGAYISNPAPQHFSFLKKIATKANIKVYFVIYPHLPNYNCEKSIELLEAFFNQLPEKNILLGGDSSGGGLCMALYKHLTMNKLINVEKVIALCPWLDITLKNPNIQKCLKLDKILQLKDLQTLGKAWMGNLPISSFLHSPVNIYDWGNTPLLLINGSHELLSPDVKIFCENNKDNSNIMWLEYEKMQHVFMFYPAKEAENAVQKIIDFIKEDKKL